jgi:hypothetical protein
MCIALGGTPPRRGVDRTGCGTKRKNLRSSRNASTGGRHPSHLAVLEFPPFGRSAHSKTSGLLELRSAGAEFIAPDGARNPSGFSCSGSAEPSSVRSGRSHSESCSGTAFSPGIAMTAPPPVGAGRSAAGAGGVGVREGLQVSPAGRGSPRSPPPGAINARWHSGRSSTVRCAGHHGPVHRDKPEEEPGSVYLWTPPYPLRDPFS